MESTSYQNGRPEIKSGPFAFLKFYSVFFAPGGKLQTHALNVMLLLIGQVPLIAIGEAKTLTFNITEKQHIPQILRSTAKLSCHPIILHTALPIYHHIAPAGLQHIIGFVLSQEVPEYPFPFGVERSQNTSWVSLGGLFFICVVLDDDGEKTDYVLEFHNRRE